jgi:acetyl-CoA carboxylase biotin carboxyl carrier protein
MDFKQIQELIKIVSKSELAEVKIEQDNFKITIRNKDASQPMMTHAAPVYASPVLSAAPIAAASPASASAAPADANESEGPSAGGKIYEFKSPMIGTFYRRPSPDKDSFVKVGDEINTGDVICIIEAMKLFNEIEFEGRGRVVKILVDDSTPVEYDQPLFLIEQL